MPKQSKEKDKYPVTLSDWITILQEKTSSSVNLQLIISSLIVTVIIGLPILYKEFMGLNYWTFVFILIAFIVIWGFIRWILKIISKANKPYEELYNKIIQGQITDPKKILKEYNEIETEKKKT